MTKSSRCISILICISSLIMISTLFGMTAIASVLFYASFAVLIIQFVIYPLKSDTGKLLLIILAIAFINIIINVLFYNVARISFSYMKKYMFFAATLIFLQIISQVSVDKKQYRFITTSGILTGFIFVFAFFVLNLRTSIGISRKYLTMNFSNPNLLAMWLYAVVLCVMLSLFKTNSKLLRVGLLTETIALSYLIFLTGSRTAEICLVIAVVIFTFGGGLSKKIVSNRKLSFFVVLLPLILALLYIVFFDKFADIFGFIESEGKSLDSRYGTWNDALYYFGLHPITGSYAEASGGTGAFQMHNILLDIMSAYGIVVTALVVLFVYKILIKFCSYNVNDKNHELCIMCFIMIWLVGTTEAALFSGGQGIYIYSCIFLLLSKLESKDLMTKEMQK